jgi:hypothetical protein
MELQVYRDSTLLIYRYIIYPSTVLPIQQPMDVWYDDLLIYWYKNRKGHESLNLISTLDRRGLDRKQISNHQ